MPPKVLVRAGLCASATGIVVLWVVPEWLCNGGYGCDRLLADGMFWFGFSLIGTACFLFFRAVFFRSDSLAPALRLRIFPDLALRNVLPVFRFRPIPRFVQLPNFGLICGALLWILIFLFMIVEQHLTPYGLNVDWKSPSTLSSTGSPSQETLGVYVSAVGEYFVNNKRVPREALAEALNKELSHRAIWIVYFEADYNTLNMNAIYAMDVIQGSGAKLIWITPKMRQELQAQKSQVASRVTPRSLTRK
jgi:biopolymer transport protein ExbD